MKTPHSLPMLLGCCLLLAASLILPAPAAALSAEEQFGHGQELFEAGRYREALPLFRQALDATSSPNARLYVGRCLSRTGKLVEAYHEMERTFDDAAARAKQEARYVATRDSAAAELALLDREVGKLVVAVVAPSGEMQVSLDGAPLDSGSLGVPVAVMPGEVLVTAHDDGRGEFEQRVQVAAGETKTVAVKLGGAEPEVGTPADPVEGGEGGGGDTTAPAGGGIGTVRAIGIGVAGLGAVGMVLFAITGSMASSKYSELEDTCGGVRCTDLAQADTVDGGKSLQTAANVSAVAGGVLLVAGAAMIVFGGPGDDEAAAGGRPAWRAAALPLEGGGLLTVGGRF